MKKIEIPDEIYEKIEKKLEEYGFKTVDEYVIFELKNLLETEHEEEPKGYTEEEEEIIKKRLEDLGYM